MDGSLKNKVALVTGSTTGIGRGIAHCLASKGCSVVLTGIATQEEIEKLVQEFQSQYKGTFHYIPGDLLYVDKTQKFCQDILAVYPEGVDILVNNAGIPGRGTIEDLSVEDWCQSLAVNLTAPFILTKAFFPLMKKKGWGRIVIMSSQMAMIAEPGKIGYCTPKAGLLGFSRVVALEGAKYGVTCNAVCPSYVDAPMGHSMFAKTAAEKGMSFEEGKEEFAAKNSPSGKLIPISEVAELVAFLCSNSAASITGSPLRIDCGNTIR